MARKVTLTMPVTNWMENPASINRVDATRPASLSAASEPRTMPATMGTNYHGVFSWRQAQFAPEEDWHRGDVEEQTGEAKCEGKSNKTEAPIAEDRNVVVHQNADSARAARIPRQGFRQAAHAERQHRNGIGEQRQKDGSPRKQ